MIGQNLSESSETAHGTTPETTAFDSRSRWGPNHVCKREFWVKTQVPCVLGDKLNSISMNLS